MSARKTKPLDYSVDYNTLDAYKRLSLIACRRTAENIERLGFTFLKDTFGDSVQLVDVGDFLIAFLVEGLGTKNLVAEEMREQILLKDFPFDACVSECNAAMIANDLAVVGADPLLMGMHLAVQHADWFKKPGRAQGVINGFEKACNTIGATWSGGETPELDKIIAQGTALYGGAACGIVNPKEFRIDPENLRDGDAIILLTSSGIHANGLTLARNIASRLRRGYFTKLNNGKTFGEALLTPTHLYGPFVQRCLKKGTRIHYAINITGHGWRKLMRAPQAFRYEIERIPRPQPEFGFIQKHARATDRKMYSAYNMGAGFAIIVPQEHVQFALNIAKSPDFPFAAIHAGQIRKTKSQRSVVIKPKGITFKGETLQLR